jgi:tRNA 2-selenouridine synthase
MYSFAISRNSLGMEYTNPISFIHELPDIPMIDVRSPVEYNKGHITGALNIPVFSDVERSKIGSLYKQKGRLAAIQKGLEFVGPKMKKLAEEARSYAVGERLKVYCWRGGMRSEKMSWLFELVGLQCLVLKGGFKSYRNQLLEDFKDLNNMIVLQGPTGSGKTDVLMALSQKGEQIIDLEALAKHRGSAFGHIGMAEQPTSLQFQNDLHTEFMKLDKTRKIWIESESLSIGKVYLPETLWESLNNAPVIELSIPKNERIKRLVSEYGKFEISDLQKSTGKIGKKFGNKNVQDVLNFLDKGDLRSAAELLLNYYDKSYNYSQNKYKTWKPFIVKSLSGDPDVNADKILNIMKEIRLEV